ncbi:uncharacterized protein LOC116463972, partial [Hylobates moloch]|uniref:uncharacterized protein LOC116463972 n=1 Tax=Hylobates moloch TaxID=81572 RepID=UPI0013641730
PRQLGNGPPWTLHCFLWPGSCSGPDVHPRWWPWAGHPVLLSISIQSPISTQNSSVPQRSSLETRRLTSSPTAEPPEATWQNAIQDCLWHSAATLSRILPSRIAPPSFSSSHNFDNFEASRLFLSFVTLTLLKSTGQLFCRMSCNSSLSSAFSQ